jgi:adenine/guanine phosphoribosyltransferase-like PRPP-binding protein
MRIESDYLGKLYNPVQLRTIVERTIEVIKDLQASRQIDTIVCTGLSGQGVGFPTSMLTGIPLLVMRKPGDNTHAYGQIEGNVEFGTYIIVDDGISSGATVDRLVEKVSVFNPRAVCVGIVLWDSYQDRQWYHPEGKGISLPVFVSGLKGF